MTPYKRRVRRERAADMHAVLERLYPHVACPLDYKTPFQLLVAIMLSAQCTDARVNIVTPALFKKFPTAAAFAQAKQSEVEKYIFSTGFYRNKAKNIIGAAQKIERDFGGVVPKTMKELLALPGVARKTANVLLGELYGIAEGVTVDTHVRRFAIRFDLSDYKDPKRIEKDLMEILPQEIWWSFPHRLVFYAREYCPARPHDCLDHPLTKIYPKAAKRWPKAG